MRVPGSPLDLPGREVARLGLEGVPQTITNADLLLCDDKALAGADAIKQSAPAAGLSQARQAGSDAETTHPNVRRFAIPAEAQSYC